MEHFVVVGSMIFPKMIVSGKLQDGSVHTHGVVAAPCHSATACWWVSKLQQGSASERFDSWSLYMYLKLLSKIAKHADLVLLRMFLCCWYSFREDKLSLEAQLLEFLKLKYAPVKPGTRPVFNSSERMVVSFGLDWLQVSKLDATEQTLTSSVVAVYVSICTWAPHVFVLVIILTLSGVLCMISFCPDSGMERCVPQLGAQYVWRTQPDHCGNWLDLDSKHFPKKQVSWEIIWNFFLCLQCTTHSLGFHTVLYLTC